MFNNSLTVVKPLHAFILGLLYDLCMRSFIPLCFIQDDIEAGVCFTQGDIEAGVCFTQDDVETAVCFIQNNAVCEPVQDDVVLRALLHCHPEP